jgi:hypothetical protein
VPASLNDQFYPVLLSSISEPLKEGDLDGYFTKLVGLADRALRKGERYVVIVTNEVDALSAAGRKQVMATQARLLTPERNDVTLAAFMPLDNAFARGVVTAIRWVAPEIVKSIRFVPNLEQAMLSAIELLEAHGTPFRGDRLALRRALGVGSQSPQAPRARS